MPDLCKECNRKEREKWIEIRCECCGNKITVNKDWENPPKYCKNCMDRFAPKEINCKQCGNRFRLSSKFQIKCHLNGWDLPAICGECKHDALLIRGALGALRDHFNFPLETMIEPRGFLFTDKVAVVRNKITREKVAEVKMDTEGFIFVDQIAVAVDLKTREKISKTRETVDGLLFPERTATTKDIRAGKDTHKTRVRERGFLFPEYYSETRRLDDKGGAIESHEKTRGFIFEEKYIMTDKKEK